MSNLTVSEILENMGTDHMSTKVVSGSDIAEAERQINELIREARIKSNETSLSDIEAIVTLQGPNIKATDAMRLIYDRLAHLRKRGKR